MLSLYSDDPSSIPAVVYNFTVNLLLKRTKIHKRDRDGQFFKVHAKTIFLFCFENIFFDSKHDERLKYESMYAQASRCSSPKSQRLIIAKLFLLSRVKQDPVMVKSSKNCFFMIYTTGRKTLLYLSSVVRKHLLH